ncbi:hypothetical protein DPMN_191429 [Dreissena polymorpha]|uniref:Uncharacterized protein n=1 Tax=Dreissena polymorpha TaxID=45954 RepID=A0A9D3Y2A4_DREPO|nr:hypothetical protein DPMN_191429 [Dreissena polymorpha]
MAVNKMATLPRVGVPWFKIDSNELSQARGRQKSDTPRPQRTSAPEVSRLNETISVPDFLTVAESESEESLFERSSSSEASIQDEDEVD